MLVSSLFYVKLLNKNDYPKLEAIAKTTKSKVLYKVETFNLWYALEVNKKSYGNSIATSNYFYEIDLFDKIDPGFMIDFFNITHEHSSCFISSSSSVSAVHKLLKNNVLKDIQNSYLF